MKGAAPAGRGPRPVVAFLWSLAGSAVVLGLLLVTDPRLLQLKRARAEVRELDRRIAEIERENQEMRAAVSAAGRLDFPAEKAAREELHLVRSDELVLLYPRDSLSGPRPAVSPGPATTGRPTGIPR